MRSQKKCLAASSPHRLISTSLLLAFLAGLSGCQSAAGIRGQGPGISRQGAGVREAGIRGEGFSADPWSLAPDPCPGCIDLATALARAGVENPTIARAAEVVRVA